MKAKITSILARARGKRFACYGGIYTVVGETNNGMIHMADNPIDPMEGFWITPEDFLKENLFEHCITA